MGFLRKSLQNKLFDELLSEVLHGLLLELSSGFVLDSLFLLVFLFGLLGGQVPSGLGLALNFLDRFSFIR